MAKYLLKLKSEDNRRDSYEERICDDLSEVFLQYLSLEDKLRLECVSQQFRRTLFAKHYSLEIIPKMCSMSLTSIEIFMKKFHKLYEIQLTNLYKESDKVNMVILETIIKNYYNLTKFYFDLNTYKEVLINKTIDKYGQGLISINVGNSTRSHFPRTVFYFPPLSGLSNIEELKLYFIPDLSDTHFKRLKRLKISDICDEDFNHLKVLTEDNRNTLRHLKIENLMYNEISIEGLLTSISKLNNLIDLNIGLELSSTHLTQISLNFQHLKRLSFEYEINRNNTFSDVFLSLKGLKSLKRLKIKFYFNFSELSAEEMIDKFDLMTFKTFNKELTHLELDFFFSETIDENKVFTDIEKRFPNLKSLLINGIVINCSEFTADILSRLSNLQNIKFFTTEESQKHKIETKLKENCKRITDILIII